MKKKNEIETKTKVWLPTGPNTRFEFGQRYECIKPLEHDKCQKTLQTDRSFAFCFMFSLDKYVLF